MVAVFMAGYINHRGHGRPGGEASWTLWYYTVPQFKASPNECFAVGPTPDTVTNAPGRVSRAQFLRVGGWFTLALWVSAAVLPPLLGRPGVWSALKPAGLFRWPTALGGLLGLVVGVIVTAFVTYWRPLRVVVERLAGLIAWDEMKTSDYCVIALMAALGEEPLFRGVLQPLIGLVPTAVIFGLLHATSAAHVILAGLLGLLLGWLYQWGASLWPPIAAHLTIDLVTGLLLVRALRPLPSLQGD